MDRRGMQVESCVSEAAELDWALRDQRSRGRPIVIIWLMRNAGHMARFLVSVVIIMWFTMMTLLVFAFNDALTRRVDVQFKALQDDHREMRELVTSHLTKFSQTIQ